VATNLFSTAGSDNAHPWGFDRASKQTLHLLRLFRQHDREHHDKNLALRASHNEKLHDVLAREVNELGDAIKLYGEAFYYFAWRACKALEPIGLEFEPVGVRDARNRLIEHPDRRADFLSRSGYSTALRDLSWSLVAARKINRATRACIRMPGNLSRSCFLKSRAPCERQRLTLIDSK